MATYDYAILGAGLAGLSIAHQLQKNEKSVLLIDPNGPGGGASGAVAGLVNPAAARRAKMSWNAEACVEAIHQNLKLLQSLYPEQKLYHATGILRPAITEELAEFFQRSLTEYPWPKNWISWLSSEETETVNPDIAPNFGGLFIHSGLTVYMKRYTETYLEYLMDQGVVFWEEQTVYQPESDGYRLLNKHKKSAFAKRIIFCTGSNTNDFPEWQNVTLHSVKGELATFKLSEEPAWDHALSALGYVTRYGENELVTGSTYDHHFENLAPTEEGIKQLTQKLGNMLPEISGEAEVTERWAGVRSSTPNRLPVIGQHPEIPNMFIYTGMGSKGLLFSEYVAHIFVNYLLTGSEIPEDLDVGRFNS